MVFQQRKSKSYIRLNIAEVMLNHDAIMVPEDIRNLAKPVFKGKFKTVFSKTICLPATFQKKFPGCIVEAGNDSAGMQVHCEIFRNHE